MKYPIGIQSFEKIRTNGYVYIDKTEYIYKMVQEGSAYFLSRPRRFGKSLLVSTLEAYFKGKRELFEGLDIEKEEREWKVYPVLHIDLNAETYSEPSDIKTVLERHLNAWEDKYGRDTREQTLSDRFYGIIHRAYQTTGSPVVVLVDEYDKPLLQSIHNEPLQQEYRAILKAFYGVLKSTDAYLKFVFLTGVTKFGQVSVFSDLNHLKDISQDARYGNLCGITPEELQKNFRQELIEFARKENTSVENLCTRMKSMYDGYRFNHTMQGIYNPFSLLNAMDAMEFRSYWFATGTPTFLIELLKKSDYDLRRLESIEIDESQFTSYRAGNSDPIPVIYQSGYLTIKDYDERFRIYKLGFPNDEVKYGFLNSLVPYYTSLSGEV
ncbi:AAA family ATPase [Bacteroides caecigallinarum]|uniref:ATP-binding protein n=1 Tax=Bacteroides caecigallinarum TaxID=1411144 RepID=UPI001958C250|nr:AAA family ATPase [Bacteroides caecigallinarum]MBM6891360.1 AAA family ATPase [Bacteroides caecigallinarum]